VLVSTEHSVGRLLTLLTGAFVYFDDLAKHLFHK